MAFYGSAKGASFEDQIRLLHTAEVKGSEEYYVLIAQAREHGLNDLADAMQANANEDAAHGGRYASMLGEGVSAEDAIWDRARAFWQAEASARPALQSIADKVRAAGCDDIADAIEDTIPEEEGHAKRLEAVFKAHGKTLK